MDDFTASLDEKWDLLIARIKAVCDAFGYGEFVGVKYRPRGAFNFEGNEERRRMMGNPARYFRVEFESPTGESPNVFENPALVAHQFGIMLWFELDSKNDDTFEADQERFYTLLENKDDDLPGLFPYLRNVSAFKLGDIDGTIIDVLKPQDVVIFPVSLDRQQKERALYTEFSITLV